MKISALIPARYDSIRFPGKLMKKRQQQITGVNLDPYQAGGRWLDVHPTIMIIMFPNDI